VRPNGLWREITTNRTSVLALELGKPMLINDEDFDTEYPEILVEEQLGPNETQPTPLPPILLLANIHIARLMAPLSKMFRTLCITNDALTKFESYLGDCLQLFPRPLQLSSTTPLDPCIMAPLIYFQNTRILLHRHNISPSCSPEQRAQAIEQCVHASRDTASLLSRCMIPHIHSHDWEQRFVLSATSGLCTHIWRCMLFLLFRQFYEAFMVLLRAASIIGDSRSINISCGRYLSFFSRRLIERYEQSVNIDVEQDEEVLTYLSADLQATTNSWVWGSAETGTHLSRRQKHGRPKHANSGQESQLASGPQSPSWDSVLTEEEQHDWGGWQHIDRSVQYLQQLTERPRQRQHDQLQSGFSKSEGISPISGPTLAPINTTNQPGDSNRARMTIANII